MAKPTQTNRPATRPRFRAARRAGSLGAVASAVLLSGAALWGTGVLGGWGSSGTAMAEAATANAEASPDRVAIARLIYSGDKTAACYASRFLQDINEQTGIEVDPELASVNLADVDLYDHPFAILSGEGPFAFGAKEKAALKHYLNVGGFVVASAGCSSASWAQSFEALMRELYPDVALETLSPEHPVFHTLYDISEVQYKRGADRVPTLKALVLDGRVVMVFSPDGINDTANAGGDCCCCGGNEIKAGRQINANLLVYALAR